MVHMRGHPEHSLRRGFHTDCEQGSKGGKPGALIIPVSIGSAVLAVAAFMVAAAIHGAAALRMAIFSRQPALIWICRAAHLKMFGILERFLVVREQTAIFEQVIIMQRDAAKG